MTRGRSAQPRTQSLRDADAEYRRRYRADCRAQLARDPGSVEHGRPQTYRDYGCRCDLCREAVAAEHAIYKPKRPKKGKR